MRRNFSLPFAIALGIGMTLVGLPAALAAVNPPSNFNILATSSCAIDMSWSASPSPNVHYYIEYTTSTSFVSGGSSVATTANLSAEHSNLIINSGWNYRYHIQAVNNSNGNVSSWVDSNPATTSTLYLAAPGTPSNLTANGNSGVIGLTWDDPTPPGQSYGGFEIWRGTTPTNLTRIGNSSTTFFTGGHYFYDDGSAPANSVLYYKVRSYDSDYGCGSAALVSSFSNVVEVPTKPSGLSAIYQFQPLSQVNLNWTASAGQDYYEVWRATSTNPLAFYSNSVSNSFSDANPASNQQYSYEIRGCTNGGGCSDFSNVSVVTIANAPQNLKAWLYYSTSTTGNVYLSWDNTFPNPPYSGNYLVERSVDGGAFSQISGASIAMPASSVARVEYYDDGLALNHVYVYRVRADFGGSYSEYSLSASIDTNLQLSLTGTAWAMMAGGGNAVGWVNFNGTSADGSHYSVQADKSGVMSGAAWSSIDGKGYGWLSFNQNDLNGCPSDTCAAMYSSSTGAMSGWARFFAAGNPSGWDGWVSLSGTAQDGSSYGVNLDKPTGNFVGAAWGSNGGTNDVGWFAFTQPSCNGNCTVSAILPNSRPTVSSVRIGVSGFSNGNSWLCGAVPAYYIAWNYNDNESNPAQSVEIKITGTTTTVATENLSGSTVYQPNGSYFFYDPLSILAPNSSFTVQVRASDGIAGFSNWANGNSATTTPAYYYPLVDFNWNPSAAATGTAVTFNNLTSVRTGAPAIGSLNWDFSGGRPASSTESSPRVRVIQSPMDVTLTVKDAGGNSCIGSATIGSAGSTTVTPKRRIFIEQ